MKKLLKGGKVVLEGESKVLDILIVNDRIEKIASNISVDSQVEEIDCSGKYILPGCIDDQVHFREPGLTQKANIKTESMAAAAGGITSFMEMPNTVPNTLTQELLEDKYQIASKDASVNYSFYMGASNDNIEEVLKTEGKKVCGVKIFMGSSTGNMLVDEEQVLEGLFSRVPWLIATHCEDEATVKANLQRAQEQYGEKIPFTEHPIIRSEEACYLSSSKAVAMAKKHGTRLHILHISTAKELDLFDNTIPLKQKKITAEACVHHLWFTQDNYPEKGAFIKWNPAVKKASDRDAIWQAVLDDRIDVIATDHAPHTFEEKSQTYLKAPSGGPLVQHALLAMLDKVKEGVVSLEKIVEKMAHAPAEMFDVIDRGYIREGYKADLVVVDPNNTTSTEESSLFYKCGWTPFSGHTFSHKIDATFVNGNLVYDGSSVKPIFVGERLAFDR